MTGREQTANRFWSKVDKTGDCWIWRGANNGRGYGRFSQQGRLVYAHRWSYESSFGAIGDGQVVDHLCRNRSCVNPDHLEAVPQGTNTSRGLLGFGLDGTCRSGRHDITDPSNVSSRGSKRWCRLCAVDSKRARRAAA